MKTTLLSVAVAAALSTASLAYAGPQTADSANDSANDSVKINAPSRYYMPAQDFADYQGSYGLSNGDTLKLTQRIGHFYAVVNGEKVELQPTSRASFVTSSGATLRFTDDGYNVTITNYERIATAANLPANTIVMARR